MIDDELRTAFERNAAEELPREPFLSEVQRRIDRVRSRRRHARVLAQAFLVALIALASPWLIAGSALLSQGLDALFAQFASFLGTPLGIGFAAACVATALIYRWRYFSRH